MPAGTGSTNVALGTQPAGFSTPSQPQYTQVTATVVAPDGTGIGNVTTGVNMQTPVTVTLGSAPSAPINVTVTSLDPSIATVSNSATTAGTVAGGMSSTTFSNVTSAYVGTVYIQGQTVGTASLQVTNTGTFHHRHCNCHCQSIRLRYQLRKHYDPAQQHAFGDGSSRRS